MINQTLHYQVTHLHLSTITRGPKPQEEELHVQVQMS